LETDVAVVCGPKGIHNPAREAVRHGSGAGSVTLAGRRVPVRRPRMRTADGAAEVPVSSYELFSSTEILGRMTMEKMLVGISTRCYPVGLEPVGQRTKQVATATNKSAIPRQFVAVPDTALCEQLTTPAR
jgi:putative transposase